MKLVQPNKWKKTNYWAGYRLIDECIDLLIHLRDAGYSLWRFVIDLFKLIFFKIPRKIIIVIKLRIR